MAEKNSTSQASEWRFSEIPTEDGLTSKGRLGFVISKKRETQRQGRTVTASLSLSPEEISNPSSAVLELEQRVSDDWGSRYRNGEIGRRGPTSLQLRQENVPSIQAARALRAMADGSYKPQNVRHAACGPRSDSASVVLRGQHR